MKYLKRFEAKKELFGPKLITANAKAHLAYMEDTDFDIDAAFYGKGQVILQIEADHRIYNWSDFKDDILSYLEYLRIQYDIVNITMNRVMSRGGLMEELITFEELDSNNDMEFNALYIVLKEK